MQNPHTRIPRHTSTGGCGRGLARLCGTSKILTEQYALLRAWKPCASGLCPTGMGTVSLTIMVGEPATYVQVLPN